MKLKQRKEEFEFLVSGYSKYSEELRNEFIDYWTEHSPKGRKMRFEKEKTFDIGKRLARWYKNGQKWNKKKPMSLAEKMRIQYGLQ